MNRRTFLKSSTALVALAPLAALHFPDPDLIEFRMVGECDRGVQTWISHPSMTMDDLNKLFYGDDSVDPFAENRAKVIGKFSQWDGVRVIDHG